MILAPLALLIDRAEMQINEEREVARDSYGHLWLTTAPKNMIPTGPLVSACTFCIRFQIANAPPPFSSMEYQHPRYAKDAMAVITTDPSISRLLGSTLPDLFAALRD